MPAGPTSLVDLLRAPAQRSPGRQAILHRGAVIHYGDLWREVRRAANALRAGELQPGDRVALLIENSIEYVIAYYAVLQAGGVAVGLNSTMRGPELVRNVTHCAATALIAMPGHPELPGLIAACGTLRQVVSTPATGPAGKAPEKAVAWDEWLATADDADVPATIDPLAPASIIYTSGTTGDPRGVTLSHRNLVANTLSILEYLGLTETDRIVNVLPFHFSYGNSVLHTHLAAGGSLVLENSLTYPHLVVQAMADQRATGFSGVPSTYALLLQRVKFGDFDLSSLRYLTQAGGAMAPALTERLLGALPGVRLYVMYGQTEATARISYLPPDRLAAKLGSVGIGIPGITIEVHDEAGRSVPTGTDGEVCVRGDNVMIGYWENPAASAKVLRDGWLHTGDIGQLDADGYLTLVGRSSDMIKTGAYRVSPLEIEEVVLELAEVAECAAVGVVDPILGEVVRVCVVAADGAAQVPRAVQAHCRDRLAAYKVPKEVVYMATLPKTASGKIKRFMLKESG